MYDYILIEARSNVIGEIMSQWDIIELAKILKNDPTKPWDATVLDKIYDFMKSWHNISLGMYTADKLGMDDELDSLTDQLVELEDYYIPDTVPIIHIQDDIEDNNLYSEIAQVMYKEYLLSGDHDKQIAFGARTVENNVLIDIAFPIINEAQFDQLLLLKLLKNINNYITGEASLANKECMQYRFDNNQFTCNISIPITTDNK